MAKCHACNDENPLFACARCFDEGWDKAQAAESALREAEDTRKIQDDALLKVNKAWREQMGRAEAAERERDAARQAHEDADAALQSLMAKYKVDDCKSAVAEYRQMLPRVEKALAEAQWVAAVSTENLALLREVRDALRVSETRRGEEQPRPNAGNEQPFFERLNRAVDEPEREGAR